MRPAAFPHMGKTNKSRYSISVGHVAGLCKPDSDLVELTTESSGSVMRMNENMIFGKILT